MSQKRILFGFPSKGRLQKEGRILFERAGLIIQESRSRGYAATLARFPDIDVILMPASEIALALGQKNIHLGITGLDLLRENFPGTAFHEHNLRWGACDVVLAVPESWVDITVLDDLMDAAAIFRREHGRRMRIATKYPNLAREFFSERGFLDYQIVESLGATEAAPARGSAEMIVDIVSTGRTLRANHLKPIADALILKSAATLAAPRGEYGDDARRQGIIKELQNAIIAASRDPQRDLFGSAPPNDPPSPPPPER